MKKNLLRFFKKIVLILTISWSTPAVHAQQFYTITNYDPAQSNNNPGMLGTLYNAERYLLKNIPTLYYGNQDVYATAYLPFVETEYDSTKPIALFGADYTTGIALASYKSPALGLYSDIQVATSQTIGNTANFYAFAAIIPHDQNEANYQGPFDTLPYLNNNLPGFVNPTPGIAGISALKCVQEFNQFTHQMFPNDPNDPLSDGWNGYDKNGNSLIQVHIFPYMQVAAFASYSNNVINIYKNSNYDTGLSRSIIGHEIAHGIINHIPFYYMFDTETDSKKELNEGFADIMGVSFSNWMSPQKFENPNWAEKPEYYSPIAPGVQKSFTNPKVFEEPNTYLGQNFVNPADENYDEHTNGAVLKYWFYLLNNYQQGHIDDDPTKAKYITIPLIPDNKDATFKLALRIIFKTFTEKLGPTATYPEVVTKTLEAAQELGYPPNSFVYEAIKNAWFAVNLHSQPDIYHIDCGIIGTGESILNGPVDFPTQEFSYDPDPTIPKSYKLVDCTQVGIISTSEFLVSAKTPIDFWDAENDGIYGLNNDPFKSKIAVGVHAFTVEARNWFKDKFGWDGPDGTGTTEIINALGNPDEPWPSYNSGNNTYSYPYIPELTTIDIVADMYFRGVNFHAKKDTIESPVDLAHPDWPAIIKGLGALFSLNIKNEHKATLAAPQPPVWTFGESVPNNPAYLNFAKPGLNQKPSLYKGLNWNYDVSAKNFSLLTFWYYLLVHGTDGINSPGSTVYTNENGHKYVVLPIGKNLALQMIWMAYTEFMPVNGTFIDFKKATEKALVGLGYPVGSDEWKAWHDAWGAILDHADYAASLKHSPENGETIYPWMGNNPNHGFLSVEAEYPNKEKHRLFQVSEDPYFNADSVTVYQFKESMMSPVDENGKSFSFGVVNLEENKTYYWRSRLSEVNGSCEGRAGDNSVCMQLKNKEKWTETYWFKTGSVDAISNMGPTNGEVVPAWVKTDLSWSYTPGASSFEIMVNDQSRAVAKQSFDALVPDDQTELMVHRVIPMLASQRPYSWTVQAVTRLGSPKAVHVYPPELGVFDYQYIDFSPEERAAMPIVRGPLSDSVVFKTDLPKVVLGTPANHSIVPMIGPVTMKAISSEPRADFFRWTFHYGNPEGSKYTQDVPVPEITCAPVQTLKFVEDMHEYGWSFTPGKNITGPFGSGTEDLGETSPAFYFKVSQDSIPEPKLQTFSCAAPGKGVVLHWAAVPGATHYMYSLKRAVDNLPIVSDAITDQLHSMDINGASEFNEKYIWSVRAGVKDAKGEWAFGQVASSTYTAEPPLPGGLSPDLQSGVALGPNQSLTFTWAAVPGAVKYEFNCVKSGNVMNSNDRVEVNGTSITRNNLSYATDYIWEVLAYGPSGCASASGGAFTTEAVKESPKPINSDLAFTLDELSSDDFDMIIKTPGGDVFTYSDPSRYVQDTQGDVGPDIAFFTNPQEGEYEISVKIFAINAHKCPALFTLKALENGAVKEVLGNNIEVICLNYFEGAEIGQVMDGAVTTFKYKYTK